MKKTKLLSLISALTTLGGSVSALASGCTWHYTITYDDKLHIMVDDEESGVTFGIGESEITVTVELL